MTFAAEFDHCLGALNVCCISLRQTTQTIGPSALLAHATRGVHRLVHSNGGQLHPSRRLAVVRRNSGERAVVFGASAMRRLVISSGRNPIQAAKARAPESDSAKSAGIPHDFVNQTEVDLALTAPVDTVCGQSNSTGESYCRGTKPMWGRTQRKKQYRPG